MQASTALWLVGVTLIGAVELWLLADLGGNFLVRLKIFFRRDFFSCSLGTLQSAVL